MSGETEDGRPGSHPSWPHTSYTSTGLGELVHALIHFFNCSSLGASACCVPDRLART